MRSTELRPTVPSPRLGRDVNFGARQGSERLALTVLGVALFIGAALRVWLALVDDGLYWPDEIYQSVEPAHRLVFGYGLSAWEFVRGARNWMLPGFVAAVMKVCALLGLDDPRQYVTVIRLLFAAMGVATAGATYMLARRLGAAPLPAACGAALFALLAPAVYFSPHALSEVASALPVVLGFALTLPSSSPRWQRLLGCSLLGLAVLLRLQNGLFCLGLLTVLAVGRRWRELIEAIIVFAACALLFGWIDLLTWGRWFHSARVYLRFNILESSASWWFGTSPAAYFLQVMWTSMPLPALVLGMLLPFAARPTPALLIVAVGFILVHTLIPHKEFRYLLPALALLCAAAAIGAGQLRSLGGRPLEYAACAALVLSAVWSAATLRGLTFGDLGQREDLYPRSSTFDVSAFDNVGPENRLLMAASRLPDVCGLKVSTADIILTGGYSYFHRPVPLYSHDGPPRESRLFNYEITREAPYPGSATVVASEGPLALLRLSDDGCVPDPYYSWRLSGFPPFGSDTTR